MTECPDCQSAHDVAACAAEAAICDCCMAIGFAGWDEAGEPSFGHYDDLPTDTHIHEDLDWGEVIVPNSAGCHPFGEAS